MLLTNLNILSPTIPHGSGLLAVGITVSLARMRVEKPPMEVLVLFAIAYEYTSRFQTYVIWHTEPDNISHIVVLILEPLELQVGNPFLDQNYSVTSPKPTTGTPMLCAAEYQHHPDFFRLPAASPFDNFLKAAGSWSQIAKESIQKFCCLQDEVLIVNRKGSPSTGCFQISQCWLLLLLEEKFSFFVYIFL